MGWFVLVFSEVLLAFAKASADKLNKIPTFVRGCAAPAASWPSSFLNSFRSIVRK